MGTGIVGASFLDTLTLCDPHAPLSSGKLVNRCVKSFCAPLHSVQGFRPVTMVQCGWGLAKTPFPADGRLPSDITELLVAFSRDRANLTMASTLLPLGRCGLMSYNAGNMLMAEQN